MGLAYDETEVTPLMYVHRYDANANTTNERTTERKRERKGGRERERNIDKKEDKPRSFAYPAAFLILLASLFIFRYVN